MAKKTAIRRVSKLVPFSPEVAVIVDEVELREFRQMRNATPISKEPINPFKMITSNESSEVEVAE